MFSAEPQTENDLPSIVSQPVQEPETQEKSEEIAQMTSEETTAETEIRFGRR